MCGICGIYDPNGELAPISKMNQTQRHRGPDDEGYLFINTENGEWQSAGGPDTHKDLQIQSYQSVDMEQFNLVLGSRRLSILDLSSAGHMPMASRNGEYWLTYNGEIYNYKELRIELKSLGYLFESDTDTEIILAAYAEWGTECLSRFNGMFAFALWDSNRSRIFCARDRFGIKPFYYFWSGTSFIFASEIKSLLQHPRVARIPNDQVIFDYLARGLSDHSESTFFEGINTLNPAHFIILDIKSGSLRDQGWWQAEINSTLGDFTKKNQEQICSNFSGLLEDTIRLRLRSDVPVGSCLSGGLDSSSIVCLANQLLINEHIIPDHLVGEHQKTFTARNQESEIDEYVYSHLVVEQTGAEEHIIYPKGELLWSEIESFLWHMDEPIDSTSQYLQWNVMRLAKQNGVTVLLDGQGGDEILGGYYAYFPPYLNQVKQQQGLFAALRAGWAISRIGGVPVRNTLIQHGSQQLPWYLQKIIRLFRSQYIAPGQGGTGLKDWQLSKAFFQRFWDRRWQPMKTSDGNELASILYRDLTSTNLPKLLRYEDRNSMAYSLETRLPFLDYRLVELVFSLPLSYRIRDGWNKWILRQSLSGVLPDTIRWRRNKLGFPTPERKWLLQGSHQIRLLLEQYDNDQLAVYIQPGILKQIREQPDDVLATTPGLWRIINLIVWFNLFFNKPYSQISENLV
jgi:asparagine synthase (glutamine-hydrolysing)